MNVLVMGAGAIGSFFGGVLAKKHNVVLIGRKPHVNEINKSSLKIVGKTKLTANVKASDSLAGLSNNFDLIILTVKSYDTEIAAEELSCSFSKNVTVLSLQNGLGNIEKITKYFDKKNVIGGITSNGVIFEKPGLVNHTGKGYTALGEISGEKTDRIKTLVEIFNNVGINTSICEDILKEIWEKAIVNSSINPLTAFFGCKNGHILENTVLEKFAEEVCIESTNIANNNGIELNQKDMISKTKNVIKETYNNHSSMLQSLSKGKTEIDSINGMMVRYGKKKSCRTVLNESMVYLIKSIS